MRITVVGLGYVGTVAGACFAEQQHDVTFVDVNSTKVNQLNRGVSPVLEDGLPELISAHHAAGRLRATHDLESAVGAADVTVVCVGTPTGRTGDVQLDDLVNVTDQIGRALSDVSAWHVVLVTSTVPPGTTERVILPRLEKESGKTCGLDFGVAFSPEFLREGSAISDFCSPAKTVIGATDPATLARCQELLNPFTRRLVVTTMAVAETVKFTDNAWHALKIAFANEIARFCDAQDIDSQQVMEVFRSDTHLNVSPAYLRPGFAFGGSCLPKDLRTLGYRGRAAGVHLPVLEHVLDSNQDHLELALRKIELCAAHRIALLGLAFKAGTDDLRESPTVELAERLLGKGHQLVIHDEHVSLQRLVGANRDYLLRTLPHVASLLCDDLEDAVRDAELVVVAQSSPAYADIIDRVAEQQTVIDLTGVAKPSTPHPNYRGFLW